MKMGQSGQVLLPLILLFMGCGAEGKVEESPTPSPTATPTLAFEWDLPQGFPLPSVPEDNPMRWAKIDLGRHLFYDTRLSGNQTQSCGTCHIQSLAFTDGKAHAEGSTGEIHRRSSMSLANVGYASVLTWANPLQTSLEAQALIPIFGEFPVELGMAGQEDILLERLAGESLYQDLFAKSFPGDEAPISLGNLTKALATFERFLISGNSEYDKFIFQSGEADFSDSAYRGFQLYFSERMECFHCHGGFNFSDSNSHEGTAFDEVFFHNTGLYNVDGTGAYPLSDQGLIEVTGLDADMGRFKAPTLRNIAVTGPYMHDGSILTLEDAILHYAAGGRIIDGEVGADNPYKSPFVPGFEITDEEMADLLAFLESLTDEDFLTDPALSDPWE